MEFKYISEAVELYKKFVAPYKGMPRFCLDTEIENLEKQIGFELPLAYREFLRFMGRDYDGIFCGSNCFVNDVVENTKYLPELLAENEVDFALPQNYLAFFSHQGSAMLWFELPKTDDDPAIWFFQETEKQEPPKLLVIFSEWLLEIMKNFAPNKL